MSDRTFKVTELVGASNKSFADAVSNAVKRAGKTIRGLGWFEVVDLRGKIDGNKVKEYQATIKVGFELEE